MEQLSLADYRNLLNCIAELYAHSDLDTFPERLLTSLQMVISADYSTFTEVNERFKRVGCISNPAGVVPKPTREQQARYFGEHPLWLHYTKTRFTTPAKISDYVPRRRYRESAFYREIFRELGVEAMMASSPLNPRGGILPAVAFIRSASDFTETDRLKLALLHPHVHRAYKQAERATVLREQNALLAESLAVTQQGIVTLSASGSILLCTDPARRYLARYFGLPQRNGHSLPDTLRRWLRCQELPAARNRSAAVPSLREPFIVERNDGRLAVHLLSGPTTGQRILLMEEQCMAPSAKLLQQHLGLTPREAEVLYWVAQGKTDAGIGILLDVSTATVEKHLEHIRAKLKVETRTAAARCAHEVFSRKRHN